MDIAQDNDNNTSRKRKRTSSSSSHDESRTSTRTTENREEATRFYENLRRKLSPDSEDLNAFFADVFHLMSDITEHWECQSLNDLKRFFTELQQYESLTTLPCVLDVIEDHALLAEQLTTDRRTISIYDRYISERNNLFDYNRVLCGNISPVIARYIEDGLEGFFNYIEDFINPNNNYRLLSVLFPSNKNKFPMYAEKKRLHTLDVKDVVSLPRAENQAKHLAVYVLSVKQYNPETWSDFFTLLKKLWNERPEETSRVTFFNYNRTEELLVWNHITINEIIQLIKINFKVNGGEQLEDRETDNERMLEEGEFLIGNKPFKLLDLPVQ